MVHMHIYRNGKNIIADCQKDGEAEEFFQLVIDPETKEIEKIPAGPDIDASAAASRLYKIMEDEDPLPIDTVSAWG